MIYPVTVYDADGNVKQVITGQDLITRYWKHLEHQFERPDAGVADLLTQPGIATYVRKGPPKKTFHKVCGYSKCKRAFLGSSGRSKYCSKKCRKAIYRLRNPLVGESTLNCMMEGCGKEFKSRYSHGKYCSPVCTKQANTLKSRRASERAKANILKRKLENARREKEILQRQHTATLEGSEVREACIVQAV